MVKMSNTGFQRKWSDFFFSRLQNYTKKVGNGVPLNSLVNESLIKVFANLH